MMKPVGTGEPPVVVIFFLSFLPQLYPLPLPSCPSYVLFTKFHAPHGVEWGSRGKRVIVLQASNRFSRLKKLLLFASLARGWGQ